MMNLDLTARLLILEGCAGVEPFTWTQATTPDFNLVIEALHHMEKGQKLHPMWMKLSPTPMISTLEAKAEKVLRNTQDISGEDIVQNAVMGFSARSEHTPCFYAAGEKGKIREAILMGKATPTSLAHGPLGRWIERKAISALRRKRALSLESGDPDAQRWEEQQAAPVKDESTILAETFTSDSPGAVELRRLLEAEVLPKVPGKMSKDLMRVWFEALNRGQILTPGLQWLALSGMDCSPSVGKVRTWRAWEKSLPLMKAAIRRPQISEVIDLALHYRNELRG